MKKFFKELISDGNKKSMVRFAVLVTLFCFLCWNVVFAVYVMYGAMTDNNIQWLSMSTFYGTLALNLFTVLGVKTFQKKYEQGNGNTVTE